MKEKAYTKTIQRRCNGILKAAEGGFSPAQNRLGEMYEEGQGVPKNRKVAKEWHKKACDNGFQDGCNDYRKLNNEGH